MKPKHFYFIFFTSVFLAIAGIFAEMMVYNSSSATELVQTYFVFFIFKSINLNIGIESPMFGFYNIIFYVLLLFGSIFYFATNGKEIRLIRFFFAVLFINRIMGFFQILINKLIFNKDIQSQEENLQNYYFMIVPILLTIGYIAVSFYIVKFCAERRELDITKNKLSENYIINETPKSGRFSHHIIDSIIIIFLCFDVATFLYYSIILKNDGNFPAFLSSEYAVFLLIILIRLFYFPFFEKLFGATPGKFLTNSRVVNSKAEIPDFNIILTRTVCRLIPFDALSFTGRRGWHNALSNTYVVKEKEEGIPVIYISLLLIISFLVMAAYLIWNSFLKYY